MVENAIGSALAHTMEHTLASLSVSCRQSGLSHMVTEQQDEDIVSDVSWVLFIDRRKSRSLSQKAREFDLVNLIYGSYFHMPEPLPCSFEPLRPQLDPLEEAQVDVVTVEQQPGDRPSANQVGRVAPLDYLF